MNIRWFLSFLFIGPLMPAVGQIPYEGGAYVQDFNSMDSGVIYQNYTNMPAGWGFLGLLERSFYVWTAITNGGFNANYKAYCVSSAASDPDKSVGIAFANGTQHVGVRFRNRTGRRLSSVSVRYAAKQWLSGKVGVTYPRVPCSFSFNATNLATGLYSEVPELGMSSFINTDDSTFTPLNGNAPTNRQTITGTISGLAWEPEQDIWIRWSGVGGTPLITIDDFILFSGPEIHVRRADSATLVISWPTNYSAYNLQTADEPNSSIWNPVAMPPAVSDGENVIRYDISGRFQFFRLHME